VRVCRSWFVHNAPSSQPSAGVFGGPRSGKAPGAEHEGGRSPDGAGIPPRRHRQLRNKLASVKDTRFRLSCVRPTPRVPITCHYDRLTTSKTRRRDPAGVGRGPDRVSGAAFQVGAYEAVWDHPGSLEPPGSGKDQGHGNGSEVPGGVEGTRGGDGVSWSGSSVRGVGRSPGSPSNWVCIRRRCGTGYARAKKVGGLRVSGWWGRSRRKTRGLQSWSVSCGSFGGRMKFCGWRRLFSRELPSWLCGFDPVAHSTSGRNKPGSTA
jgi:hypothetical protein